MNRMDLPKTALALFVAGLAVTGCSPAPDAQGDAPPLRPVLVTTAKVIDSEEVGPFIGTIQPRYQTPMSFRTAGRMISRPARLGDSVVAGEALATLDFSVQQLQVDAAAASLASAEAQLGNLRDTEERVRTLVERGSASEAQLDAAVTARRSAEAQVAQAKASLKSAQDQLEYTTLRAEFDGLVVSTSAEVGQVVSAGSTIVTVARPDIREAVFQLPETEAEATSVDTVWRVSVVGFPEETMRGTIREMSPQLNGSTRSRTVRLTLEDPSSTFRLGAVVEVSRVRSVPEQVLVPQTAVFEREGTSFVWVVDPETLTVAARQVAVTRSSESSAIISSGLDDGDMVVSVGVQSLEDGQKVAAAEEESK